MPKSCGEFIFKTTCLEYTKRSLIWSLRQSQRKLVKLQRFSKKQKEDIVYYARVGSYGDYGYLRMEDHFGYIGLQKLAGGMKIGETRYFDRDFYDDEKGCNFYFELKKTTDSGWDALVDQPTDYDDMKHENIIPIPTRFVLGPRISFPHFLSGGPGGPGGDDDEEEEEDLNTETATRADTNISCSSP